ncbi:Arc-like DNA binding domain-containing protein [Duganella sp. CF517]|nr:Arc family DNA-binding protein [Duganella sp. CF517]SEN31856.1 Arc-like DNA binding domain-containing protein [Duganella sp. CF517]
MTQKTAPPSKTAEQFVVRLPDGMRDRIAESAKRYNRSMNAEIVSILQDYYDLRDYHDQLVDESVEAQQPQSPPVVYDLAPSPEALKMLADLIGENIDKRYALKMKPVKLSGRTTQVAEPGDQRPIVKLTGPVKRTRLKPKD